METGATSTANPLDLNPAATLVQAPWTQQSEALGAIWALRPHNGPQCGSQMPGPLPRASQLHLGRRPLARQHCPASPCSQKPGPCGGWGARPPRALLPGGLLRPEVVGVTPCDPGLELFCGTRRGLGGGRVWTVCHVPSWRQRPRHLTDEEAQLCVSALVRRRAGQPQTPASALACCSGSPASPSCFEGKGVWGLSGTAVRLGGGFHGPKGGPRSDCDSGDPASGSAHWRCMLQTPWGPLVSSLWLLLDTYTHTS